ncbi:MAG: hypothetical protein CMJ85_04185 [Planctomycetes bacterium]|nr:hypothetical protein [Planctomycetota bacterium]
MDADVKREVLQRIDQKQGRTPLLLILMGLAFVMLALFEILGGPVPSWMNPLTRIGLGMLFVYMAAVVFERQRLQSSFRDLLEAHEGFMQTIYGKDYKKHRAAIDILIGTLRTEDAEVRGKVVDQLRRVTGQDLPEDAEQWEKWWRANKAGFSANKAE